MTYTDVFGNSTVPPSDYGYRAVTLSTNTQFYWPYNSTGEVVAKLMEITAGSGLSMNLPDATEVSTGEDILLKNVGANSFSVLDKDGGAIATVASGSAVYVYLTDNSDAAGVWGTVAFGVGTSSVDAATLAGYGVLAVGSTLNQSHPVLSTASGITLGAIHRATLVNFTGGVDTMTLPSASSTGNNFFTFIKNSGTGTLTHTPNGADTIDGLAEFNLQPGESIILVCSGTAWFTVGYGRSVSYNFTQLVLDVSAGGTITLTQAQAANKLITFVGSPTGAVTVEVPATVNVYYVLSSISTAQTVTVKTNAGTGSAVSQGARQILICDATNVYSAQSATASTTLQLLDGSSSVPALSFASQTNTGLYKYSSTGFGFSVDGTSRYSDDGTTITIGALSGLIKRVSGVESAAVAGTDYVAPGGALGTPSSGTLTNCAGLPQAGTVGLTTADSPQFAGVNIGHASDTTLTRVSAGVVAVEGSNILLASGLGSITQAYDVDTAKTDVAQTWSNYQRTQETADNDLSFDLNNANPDFTCTPTAGGALTFTNIPATPTVAKGTVLLSNTSNYAITAAANTKISTADLTTISATGTYLLAYRSSNWNVYVWITGNFDV